MTMSIRQKLINLDQYLTTVVNYITKLNLRFKILMKKLAEKKKKTYNFSENLFKAYSTSSNPVF